MDESSILWEWRNTRFLGVPCSQVAADFIVWEHVLNEVAPVAREGGGQILELGSLRGGFSLFLALQAMQRGMAFRTFDNQSLKRMLADENREAPYAVNTPTGLAILFGKVVEEDVLLRGEAVRGWLTRPGLTVLFCDNGDKIREVLTYAPLLKVGDLLAVHDWGTEVGPEDVAGVLVGWRKLAVLERSMTAFFVR